MEVRDSETYSEVKIIKPDTGLSNFDDFDSEDYNYIESVALIHLDGILMKKNAKENVLLKLLSVALLFARSYFKFISCRLTL